MTRRLALPTSRPSLAKLPASVLLALLAGPALAAGSTPPATTAFARFAAAPSEVALVPDAAPATLDLGLRVVADPVRSSRSVVAGR